MSTKYASDQLLSFHRCLLLPRVIEEKMLIMLRQGKISKWFSGYGQEAISVGAALAMDPEEYILTMHRNLGVFTTREVPLRRLFAQFQGKAEGFTMGRDRSFHFGSKAHHIAGMISHLGPQLGVADGIALAELVSKSGKSTLVFTGDGGASEGDFHEALNVAAVWDLPVIFVVENNQWGLSTPSIEQFRCKQFVDKGIGYGMEAIQVDGNDLLSVYETIQSVRSKIAERPRPFLVECLTFRIRGHEEASGTKYYPDGIVEHWEKKDPVDRFERWLIEEGIAKAESLEATKEELKREVSEAFAEATNLPAIEVNKERELADVYPIYSYQSQPHSDHTEEMRFVDAVSDGLRQAMRLHDNLLLMGQDIAEYGGVFKVTEGFVAEFGKARVRNTPLCESAILGAGLGLSMRGFKSMVEMQFADFVSSGFNQIVNNLAKIHYRWGHAGNVVVRMPTGAGVAAGPFHSQSNEAWFTHTPGLRVVYPSNPMDAKGMLMECFNYDGPVLFFEHKALYRSLKGAVPTGVFTADLEGAQVVAEGEELSIVTYGMGVHWAMAWRDEHQDRNVEIIDLRSLAPIDYSTIFNSVKKTGKVLVLHEDVLTGGIGGEIAAQIGQHCFEFLDAPIMRCASLDMPVPFDSELEKLFLAQSRLDSALMQLIEY